MQCIVALIHVNVHTYLHMHIIALKCTQQTIVLQIIQVVTYNYTLKLKHSVLAVAWKVQINLYYELAIQLSFAEIQVMRISDTEKQYWLLNNHVHRYGVNTA